MVRDPAIETGLPYIQPYGTVSPNGLRVRRGGGDRQQHLDLAPREGPHMGEEILGFILGSVGHLGRL